MDKSNIWTAVLTIFFMLGVGIWIGISIADLSEVGMVSFWGIWLVGIGFIFMKIKHN